MRPDPVCLDKVLHNSAFLEPDVKWLTSQAPLRGMKTEQWTRQEIHWDLDRASHSVNGRVGVLLDIRKHQKNKTVRQGQDGGSQSPEGRLRYLGVPLPVAAFTLFPASSDWTFQNNKAILNDFKIIYTYDHSERKKAILYHWWMSRLQKHMYQYVSKALKKHMMFEQAIPPPELSWEEITKAMHKDVCVQRCSLSYYYRSKN